jgi:hypothetical protein
MSVLGTGRVVLRIAAAGLLSVALIGSTSVGHGDPAGAQTGTVIFDLSARADALGIEIIATGAPVASEGKVAFIGPGSSQATLNQFSGAAFASSPYPGDLVAALPSTVNGLGAGVLPPVPAYPFYVATDSSTKDDREEVGPYLLAAHTDENRSTGESRIGLSTFSPEVVSVTSRAEVTRDPDSGVLQSHATTRTAPLRINDLIAVGEIRTDATFTFDPSDPDSSTKTSRISAGSITVAGIELGITDKGLTLAGDVLVPLDVSVLTNILAGAGIQFEVVPATETERSITSAAVILTYQETFPAPLLDTTVQVVLGRSSATLATSTVAPLAVPGAPDVGSSGGDPVGLGGTGTLDLPPAPALDLPNSAPTITAAPVRTGSSTGTSAPLADFGRLYPALAGAALLAITSSRSVQWLTFRLRLATPPTP